MVSCGAPIVELPVQLLQSRGPRGDEFTLGILRFLSFGFQSSQELSPRATTFGYGSPMCLPGRIEQLSSIGCLVACVLNG